MKKKFNPFSLLLIPVILAVMVPLHFFVGNPVSKYLAGRTVKNYVAEKYPDFYIEEYKFHFSYNGYYAIIKSRENKDVRFIVVTDTLGTRIRSDDYYGSVELGENTSRRINDEYTEIIHSILGDTICGYDIYSVFGRLADNMVTGHQYSLKSGPLVPGAEYDIYKISPTDGDIILRVIAPGATDEVSLQILQRAKQMLEDGGIVFDTVTLYIGETRQCWPHIITIENIPYALFSQPDFEEKIQQMSYYNNPQWTTAFHNVTDRYIKMLQSVDWKKAETFDYNAVFVGFYLTPDCSRKAQGYNLYISDSGLEIQDIDTVNYEKYADSEIAAFGTKAGHVAFNVHSDNRGPQAAAEIMNEINLLLAEKGVRYAVADLEISDSKFGDYHYYRDIHFTDEPFTAEDMQLYLQQ